MADEFGTVELEDGELWLPSDFFSMEEVNENPGRKLSTCMDGYQQPLHRQPHNRHLCKPFTTLQRWKPAVRHGGAAAAGSICNCGAGKSWTGRSSIFEVDPVQGQIEKGCFMGERARELQNRLVLNRLSSRPGHVGTGVFLPRVSGDVAKNQDPRFAGMGPRTNYSQEFYLPPGKMLLNNRQDEDHGYFASAAAAVDDVHMPYYWNY